MTPGEAMRIAGSAPHTIDVALGHPLTPRIMLEQDLKREARKTLARRRYLRRYARHVPKSAKPQLPAAERQERAIMAHVQERRFARMVALPGFEGFMQAFVFRLFGAPGKDGQPGRIQNRGRYHSPTRKGPGRRALPSARPAGSKLWRKITGDA